MSLISSILQIFLEKNWDGYIRQASPVSRLVEYKNELKDIYFDDIIVCTQYKNIKFYLEKYKFFSEREYYCIFVDYMLEAYSHIKEKYKIEDCIITTVPMHWTRYFIRWFDHMYLIWKKISQKLWYSCEKLIWTRFTYRQVYLTKEKRLKNRENKYYPLIKKYIPETVILLDDVVTTGVSINECSRILKQMWVKRVIVLVLATNV